MNSSLLKEQKFPSFADLGKECRTLFTKGYHFGLFQINVQNTTCHGVEISTNAEHKMEDKSAKAEVNLTASYPYPGLSSSHKWDTDNNLTNEINLTDLFPGGKIALEGRLSGDSGNYGGGFKFQQKHPKFTLDAVADGGTADDSNMIVGASIVSGLKGLMGAYKIDYDTNSGNLTANDLVASYQGKDYSLVLGYDNLTVIKGFYFHKIGRDMEVGCQANVGGEEGIQFGIAGKFMFSGYGHTVRAKVNNQSLLGLGLELNITQGFNAGVSGEIDLKNFAAGPHKIGFGLDFGV